MAEHDTVWTAVSALLRAQVSEAVWLSTFQDVVPLPGGDDTLRLQVPNGHIKERVLTRYLQLVLDALAEIDENDRQLVVEVAQHALFVRQKRVLLRGLDDKRVPVCACVCLWV